MRDIKTMEDLRDDAIDTLRRVKEGLMEVKEAAVCGKLYDNVISSIKTQLEYHAMLGEKPMIAFLEEKSTIKSLAAHPILKIEEKKK